MTGSINFREYPDRASASEAAAEILSQSINSALETQNDCAIVVSGGSTPGPCFDLLSANPLDWPHVTVVPSDERWVPANHADSNDRLIRERLLKDEASAGHVLSMFRQGLTADDATDEISQQLAELSTPFAAVLLGMGEDGHFASLFPDYKDLQHALKPDNTSLCMAVKTAGSPHQRISLSLSALINTFQIVLLIFGDAKKHVFETADQGGSNYPVEGLLKHHLSPLTVIWAP